MDSTEIKNTLESRLRELTERLGEIDEDLHEEKEEDSEERAMEIADEEILEGIGSASLNEIQQIKNALERLRVGTYGTCTHCGAQISEPRLRAVPHAALCIKCAGGS